MVTDRSGFPGRRILKKGVVFPRRISIFLKSILVGFGIYFWWTLHMFWVPFLDPFRYQNASKMGVPQEKRRN